ncbi:Alpha-L-fucosidase [Novipirellula aureliae]|uniref:alpha-L-fucosidase n=1 Tax=Novipirellula aureliae TaxID=2527966 RepID=A0A5C6DV03_9BACT|nr:alpha-L-fucosidase [Novipirellula aureliae]TWU38896.1 Alpha-L-fucosidase [Novipirellula aureliae]
MKIVFNLAFVLLFPMGCWAVDNLSHVPQINETQDERDKRMEWFRDAKFGLFVHWGPCSITQTEISWGRDAERTMDIRNGAKPSEQVERYGHDFYIPGDLYDSLYKYFNPVKFDADQWVQTARDAGMQYIVFTAKHHDGFSNYHTKLSDHSIANTPFQRDIVKELTDACHKVGMKVGLYYSTRDWYHSDYLVGDNVEYDTFYRGQVEELLTNYGDVDVIWFDHVGGRDWSKWKFDELFAMMYERNPDLIINDRGAKFCGPRTPEDKGPPTAEIETMTKGDFYTPEGRIGKMDIAKDWESCIHVGKGWSYRGEGGFKTPEECIQMLVSCTTGGGNLLLNFGPRPDGTFTDAETQVAMAMGQWLKTYGDAIYGTRGGPYRNGTWGGSCHKGDKLYLHVLEWPADGLVLDALPAKVLSARTLTDGKVTFSQSDKELAVNVASSDRETPVTVIELTLDQTLSPGTIVGSVR